MTTTHAPKRKVNTLTLKYQPFQQMVGGGELRSVKIQVTPRKDVNAIVNLTKELIRCQWTYNSLRLVSWANTRSWSSIIWFSESLLKMAEFAISSELLLFWLFYCLCWICDVKKSTGEISMVDTTVISLGGSHYFS